jgi:hypothetical protein
MKASSESGECATVIRGMTCSLNQPVTALNAKWCEQRKAAAGSALAAAETHFLETAAPFPKMSLIEHRHCDVFFI